MLTKLKDLGSNYGDSRLSLLEYFLGGEFGVYRGIKRKIHLTYW